MMPSVDVVDIPHGDDEKEKNEAHQHQDFDMNAKHHKRGRKQLHDFVSEQEQEIEEEDDDDDDEERGYCFRCRRCFLNKKSIVGLFLLGFVCFVIIDSTTNGYIKTGIREFLEWIQYDNPIGGIFLFTLVCCVTTILFIPGVLLTVGSGYVFATTFGFTYGIIIGSITYFVGACLGSIISFIVGRFLLRDCVQSTLLTKFSILNALDTTLEEPRKGLRIMSLLRLSPLIYASPYLNYGIGATGMSFYSYCVSLLAIVPGTILYVFLGASAESLLGGHSETNNGENDDYDYDGDNIDNNINDADDGDDDDNGEDTTLTKIVLVVGIVLTVLAVALTSYYAKTELDKIVAAQNQGARPGHDNTLVSRKKQRRDDYAEDDDDEEEELEGDVEEEDVEMEVELSTERRVSS